MLKVLKNLPFDLHLERKEGCLATFHNDAPNIAQKSSPDLSLQEDFDDIVQSRDLSKNTLFLAVLEPLHGI